MDQVEKSLLHIESELAKAWEGNRCLQCPIGELAALAAATRQFYQEQQRTFKAHDGLKEGLHWSVDWQKYQEQGGIGE